MTYMCYMACPAFLWRSLQRWMKNCVFLESSELFIAFDANTKELFKIIWWATKIDEIFIDDIYLKVTIDIHDWSLFFCWNKDYSCSCFKFSLWNSTILMLIVRYHWGEDEHIRLAQCYQIIVAGYLLLNGLCQSVEPSLTLKSCTAYTHQWPSKRTSVLSELNTNIIFECPKSNFLWNGYWSDKRNTFWAFQSVVEKWALKEFELEPE